MPVETVVSVVLILGGAAVMGFSVQRVGGVMDVLPLVGESTRARLRRLIRIHAILMAVFVAGYVATAGVIALGWQLIGHMVVGFIFASGAFFVYLGITIQTRLVAEIVSTIADLVPICASCKRIRLADHSPDDMTSWKPLEAYFGDTHRTKFSHGICPECAVKLFPD